MYPAYGWTDSYPHNQMPYVPCQAIPHQTMMNHQRPPVHYEPWPYAYSSSSSCHGCCNHSYFPSYYGFRPPYPHFPPPPFQCHGGYPPYFAPPHYSFEQPRYEYDKNGPKNPHCCGCPIHSCKQDAVKIEEEPEVNKRSSDLLVPSQMEDYSYPVVWIPPGYIKGADGRRQIESEPNKEGWQHNELKGDERSKSHNMNHGGSPKEEDKQPRNGLEQTEGKSQFPFPIFWFPYKTNDVGNQGETDASDSLAPSNITLLHGNEDKVGQSEVSRKQNASEADSTNMNNRHFVQKVIPVKQIEEKKSSEVIETKAKGNGVEEPLGSSSKRQSSQSKTSKSPPVCLRVDPLPRKKNGNSSSRSPSPPAKKGRSEGSSCENLKSSQQQVQSASDVEKSKHVEDARELEVDTVGGVKDEGKSEVKVPGNDATPQTSDEASSSMCKRSGESTEGQDRRSGDAEIAENKKFTANEEKKSEGNKERRNLSDTEAAVIIQASYRGFEVRKSEPLKKLRLIADVAKQVAEVRNQILNIESSSDPYIDDKQKVILGETIMSLLLKLDTIQGLHSTLRESRKFVAKELVNLQEKLDSLISKKSEDVKPVELSSNNSETDDVTQEEQETDSNRDIKYEYSSLSQLHTSSNDNNSKIENVSEEAREATKFASDGKFRESNQDMNTEPFDPSQLQAISNTDAISCAEYVEPSETHGDLQEVVMSQVTDDHLDEAESAVKLDVIDEEVNDDSVMSGELGLDRAVEFSPVISIDKTSSEVELEGSPLADVKNQEANLRETEKLPELVVKFNHLSALNDVTDSETGETAGSISEIFPNSANETACNIFEVSPNLSDTSVTDQVEQCMEEVDNRKLLNPVSIDEDGKQDEIANALVETRVERVGTIVSKAQQEENERNDSREQDIQTTMVNITDATKELEEIHVKNEELKRNMLSQEAEIINPEEEIMHKFKTEDQRCDQLVNNDGHCEETHDTKCQSMRLEDSISICEEQKLPAGDIHRHENGSGNLSEDVKTAAEQADDDKSVSSASGCGIPLKDDRNLMKENERLKEMMEELIKSGNEQLKVITKLSGKVKDLERKLSRKKKLKPRRYKTAVHSYEEQ